MLHSATRMLHNTIDLSMVSKRSKDHLSTMIRSPRIYLFYLPICLPPNYQPIYPSVLVCTGACKHARVRSGTNQRLPQLGKVNALSSLPHA